MLMAGIDSGDAFSQVLSESKADCVPQPVVSLFIACILSLSKQVPNVANLSSQ